MKRCLKCHKKLSSKDEDNGYRLCKTCRKENASVYNPYELTLRNKAILYFINALYDLDLA